MKNNDFCIGDAVKLSGLKLYFPEGAKGFVCKILIHYGTCYEINTQPNNVFTTSQLKYCRLLLTEKKHECFKYIYKYKQI